MELQAVALFEEGLAYYNMSPQSNKIYQSRFLQYEGGPGRTPPSEVTLVRGYRQWSGRYERQTS